MNDFALKVKIREILAGVNRQSCSETSMQVPLGNGLGFKSFDFIIVASDIKDHFDVEIDLDIFDNDVTGFQLAELVGELLNNENRNQETA